MSNPLSNQVILGIDLGTSNCCVAIWIDGEMNIVRNQQGERTTPSVLTSAPDGTVVVGSLARRQAVMNPKGTLSEVKRLVGLSYDSSIVQSAREILPYEITRAANGDAFVKMGERVLSPQETQAYILEELAKVASEFLGSQAQSVVITVPAFFDQTQRQAVRDAATIAGLHTVRILSEPTAAALAYGYAQLDNRRIAVVDLGGGTLDVAIMSIDRGHFEVLATDGDNQLGGADFDRTLARHFAGEIEKVHGLDVTADPVAMQRLLAEAEQTKKTLTQQQFAQISLPYLAQKGSQVIDFEFRITRQDYERLMAQLIERIAVPCEAALAQAGLRAEALDDVILIGGMTRSPMVQDRIGKLFQRKPLQRINPDEAVAMGAALLGAGLSGHLDQVTFVDVAPRSVGIRAAGDSYVTLIKKSSKLPASVLKAFRTTRDQQQSFELEILQGESLIASENRPLATVSLAPITLADAGGVILELKVEMDATGALVVHAREKGSEQPTSVAIEPFSGLTPSNVKALMEKHGNTLPSAAKIAGVGAPAAAQSGSPFATPAPPAAQSKPTAKIARKPARTAARRKPARAAAERSAVNATPAVQTPAPKTTTELREAALKAQALRVAAERGEAAAAPPSAQAASFAQAAPAASSAQAAPTHQEPIDLFADVIVPAEIPTSVPKRTPAPRPSTLDGDDLFADAQPAEVRNPARKAARSVKARKSAPALAPITESVKTEVAPQILDDGISMKFFVAALLLILALGGGAAYYFLFLARSS